MLRVSALQDVAVQGRFGADKGVPGVSLSVVHPLAIAMVIARKGNSKAVKEVLASLRSVDVLWAGPDQYFVQSTKTETALLADLQNKLQGLASITDQSHGRVVLRISGPKARAVLTKIGRAHV